MPAHVPSTGALVAALAIVGLPALASAPATAASDVPGAGLVINEVSGGNGTGTAATDEFIEIHNPTTQDVVFSGTVQYKSAAGSTFTAVSPVTTFVVPAGGYWLAAGINYSGSAAPDSRYSFDVSASTTGGGHVALTGATTGVTTPANDPLRVDLVAWGTGNTPEGAAAPSHPAAGGSLRRTNGVDTDNNSVDFVQASVRSPRGSSLNGTYSLANPGPRAYAPGVPISPIALTATGGRAPYSFALVGGGLPTGLALDPVTGQISGTPTAVSPSRDVRVRVTDAHGDGVSTTFSLSVGGGLAVADPGAQSWRVGSPVSLELEASGGSAPYVFAVTDGALPSGVSLSPQGTLSGTPTQVRAAADVTVTMTDALGATFDLELSIAVAAGDLVPVVPVVPTIDVASPVVGDVVRAAAGAWGPGAVDLAYQWLAAGDEIDGATGASFTVTEDQRGAALSVRVTGSRAGHVTASRTSVPTSVVRAALAVADPGA